MNEEQLAMMNSAMSYAGAVLGYASTKDANDTQQQIANNTNFANYKIAQETNALNYQLWQEQLQYNDPTNQMERLRRAGLNPQLVMGNMQNVATDRPTMQGTTYQPYNYQAYDVNSLINMLFKGEQYKQLVNQTKKSRAEARLVENQADIAETQSAMDEMVFNEYFLHPEYVGDKLKAENESRWLNNEIARNNITNQIIQRELTTNQANLLLQDIEKRKVEISKLKNEDKVEAYRAMLAKHNINPNSTGLDYLIEALVKNPDMIAKTLSQFIKSSFDMPTNTLNDLFKLNLPKPSKKIRDFIHKKFNL